MTVHFTNHSSHIVILSIDDGEPIFLQPFKTIQVVRNKSDAIKVLVKRSGESFISKGIIKGTMYHLVIETEYHFFDVCDGEVFDITREKIRFSMNAFYDRMFLSATNASFVSETHKVLTEEKIKKAFNKSWLIELLLVGPLDKLTGVFILSLIVGIVLMFSWGWKVSIAFFTVAYLLLVIVNWLMDKFWGLIVKKAFKIEDKKKEFYDYFNNEFIKCYYADVERTPFIGNVEIN